VSSNSALGAGAVVVVVTGALVVVVVIDAAVVEVVDGGGGGGAGVKPDPPRHDASNADAAARGTATASGRGSFITGRLQLA
jgi:hypothetical protein